MLAVYGNLPSAKSVLSSNFESHKSQYEKSTEILNHRGILCSTAGQTYEPRFDRAVYQCLVSVDAYLSDPFAQKLLYLYLAHIQNRSVEKLCISCIARSMCMSERTLHRRMIDKGLSHQSMKNDARKILCLYFLTNSSCTSQEIASKLLFKSSSSFICAFKRWFFLTPSDATKVLRHWARDKLIKVIETTVTATNQ